MQGQLPRVSTQVVLTADPSEGCSAVLHGAGVGPLLSVGCSLAAPCLCVCVFMCARVCFCVGRKKTKGQLIPPLDMLHHHHSFANIRGANPVREEVQESVHL